MKRIKAEQIIAAERIATPYMAEGVLVAAAVLEIINAFLDAGAAPKKTAAELRKGRTKLPDDIPDSHDQHLAITYWRNKGRPDLGRRLVELIEQFKAHHRARGSYMADWHYAWKTWYINSLKFERQDNGLFSVLQGGKGDSASASIDTWVKRLECFCGLNGAEKGTWNSGWGPKPNEDGCLAPAEAKVKFRQLYPRQQRKEM